MRSLIIEVYRNSVPAEIWKKILVLVPAGTNLNFGWNRNSILTLKVKVPILNRTSYIHFLSQVKFWEF